MSVYERSFKVQAPLPDVAAFHDDPVSLVAITPPPVHVTIEQFDRPVRAGSRVIFRLSVGPIGVRWDGVIAEYVDQELFSRCAKSRSVRRVEPHPFVRSRNRWDACERSGGVRAAAGVDRQVDRSHLW